MYHMIVRVGEGAEGKEGLRISMVERTRQATVVTPIIQFIEPKYIFDPDEGFKSKRIVDQWP